MTPVSLRTDARPWFVTIAKSYNPVVRGLNSIPGYWPRWALKEATR